MKQDVLLVADRQAWLSWWEGPIKPFEDVTVETLREYEVVILAPDNAQYMKNCQEILNFKREGFLPDTKIILGTYKGRHIWSPENDPLVEHWVVHARSEFQVLKTDKLAFVPLCLMPLRKVIEPGDDGYLFLGGRKWRELDVGVAAMSRSGYPGKVISDFAPEGDFPGVDIRREKIPKGDYAQVMVRSRVVLVPLKSTPISHGHVDVITAVMLGRPVIVTAGASCDDYVEHGINGLLVPDNSIEAWTDAIHEAYERADEFSVAAQEMAPRYHASNYAGHLRALAASLR